MHIRLRTLLTSAGIAAVLALGASDAAGQAGTWQRLISEADSIGPEPPPVEPARGLACGPGVEVPDSVQVTGPEDEFLFWAASLRTAGYFTSPEVPVEGVGRFALRRVSCDPARGHPAVFVLEGDHRYFYLGFSLRSRPTYRALRFRSSSGAWEAFRWDPGRRTFAVHTDTASRDVLIRP